MLAATIITSTLHFGYKKGGAYHTRRFGVQNKVQYRVHASDVEDLVYLSNLWHHIIPNDNSIKVLQEPI